VTTAARVFIQLHSYFNISLLVYYLEIVS